MAQKILSKIGSEIESSATYSGCANASANQTKELFLDERAPPAHHFTYNVYGPIFLRNLTFVSQYLSFKKIVQ